MEKIVPVYIEDEMKVSYLDYAMSVIVGRALPDVRDGLKPVHRRILYAMNELGVTSNKPHKKSARIVGEVLGKYHPHGDVAVYDTIVRMAQEFSSRYPLIDGQGNFGSVDGDAPAAMRYTEVRLHPLASVMVDDIEKETVDFIPNFDDSLKEPEVLPAKLPNLLINGSSGIAVGMATNIPPHNLREIVTGIIMVIDNRDVTIKDLMDVIPGPDFPTGGFVFGGNGIREAYETGKGKIVLQARSSIERQKGEKENIIISELPYQVNKANLVKRIADLVKEKRIEGISELRDESDRDGMRIVIELKRDGNSKVILNQLYKHTSLQTSFGIILLSLVDSRPEILNLKQMIEQYIEHRKEIVTRRTKYELKQAELRAHILEGLRIALQNLDEVIRMIRSSKTPDEAKNGLMGRFSLTSVQAQAILDMRLQRLTGLEQEKVNQEYIEVTKTIEDLRSILASEKMIYEIIKEELKEIKEKYGDDRKTQIIEETEELAIEDLIKEEDVVITLSHTDYIKRLPITLYRKQKRGGRGVIGMETKDEDFVKGLFIGSTHDYILLFSNIGKIYSLRVFDIPEGGRLSKGRALVNLLSLSPSETITAAIPIKEFRKDEYLIMATKKGLIKKTSITAYSHPRRGGIMGINLVEGDELISVGKTKGTDNIILATRKGKAIRFSEEDVRGMGRTASGVRGISLQGDDQVVGMEIEDSPLSLLTITERGYGKRTNFERYRIQKRGGKGVINIKITEKNGEVVSIEKVGDKDELVMITSKGIIIRYGAWDLPEIGRSTRGVKLINLEKGDKVVNAERITH